MNTGRKEGKGRVTEGITMIVKTMTITRLLCYSASNGNVNREAWEGKSRYN
jgi:hypothetical protein